MSVKAEATRQQILGAARKLVVERGFSGTSLDEILARTQLTKGAFFYHFKGKGDLARALINQYAEEDTRFFVDLARRSDELEHDPLQNVLKFVKLFEDYLTGRRRQLRSCLYASFSHEFDQFDAQTMEAVRVGITHWKAVYREKFEHLLSVRRPRLAVTADDLANMIVSLIEGSLILARIETDPSLVIRQCAQFRGYLELLFQTDSGRRTARRRAVPRR